MKVQHSSRKLININPNILGGTPVFNGTRVPIKALFDHLENDLSVEEFLKGFPTVTREQALELIQMAQKTVISSCSSLQEQPL